MPVRSGHHRSLGHHPRMIMAGMRKGVPRVMRMRLARGFAEQSVGQRAIVEKPVAEIGVLRPGPGCNREYVGVKAQGGSRRWLKAAPNKPSQEPDPGWNSASKISPNGSTRLVAPVGALTPNSTAACVPLT